MRLSRINLKLLSVALYLSGWAIIVGTLLLFPPSLTWIALTVGISILIGIFWFTLGYLKQFRNHKDITLEYRGIQFVVFVLGRFAFPCGFTIYGVLAIIHGRFDALSIATLLMSMFLGGDAAELFRMKQNGSTVETSG